MRVHSECKQKSILSRRRYFEKDRCKNEDVSSKAVSSLLPKITKKVQFANIMDDQIAAVKN